VLARASVSLLLVVFLLAAPARAADDVTTQARTHYEMGLKLFDARDHEQALIEFEAANRIKSRPAAIFMMAQCEYLLGRLKEARTHYNSYIAESPDGEFVELAKDRVQSIEKRPGTFAINADPDNVDVRIVSDTTPGQAPVTGQAPNSFSVQRGRYRITVSKRNHVQQTRVIDIDLGETKPLFFKLDPIPARLEIETTPPNATLYVNGNRARNPYRQDVTPGHFEIFAEAVDHDEHTLEFGLAPGERKLLTGENRFRLSYTQRSGRPELVVASGIIGAFIGAGAVAAAIGSDLDGPNVASVLLLGGGGVAGGIAGALIATPLVPRYIPDNRALFVLGMMWIGGAEGAAAGILWRQTTQHSRAVVLPCPGPGPCRGSMGEQLRAGFIGSLPGLAMGLTTGSLLSARAPTYGRVALIQSAALFGALTGALVQVGVQWKPYPDGWESTVRPSPLIGLGSNPDPRCVLDPADGNQKLCPIHDYSVFDLMPGALIGLNVGLVAGLLGAYLPDQSKYGPSWRRILLIDLAAAAGALAGGVGGCIGNVEGCLSNSAPDDDARALAAIAAIGGGALGLLGGILLTRHFDDDQPAPPTSPSTSTISLSTTLLPLRTADGRVTTGIGALGRF
jgi:hypothetical protein